MRVRTPRPWRRGCRPGGRRRAPTACSARCSPGSAAAPAAGGCRRQGQGDARQGRVQHALTVQHEHDLVVGVAVQRGPAGRDLTHELGGRRAPVARPEQHTEPPVPGDLHGAVRELGQPWHPGVVGDSGGSGERNAVQAEHARGGGQPVACARRQPQRGAPPDRRARSIPGCQQARPVDHVPQFAAGPGRRLDSRPGRHLHSPPDQAVPSRRGVHQGVYHHVHVSIVPDTRV